VEEPVFSGLLTLSGRRSRRSYVMVMLWCLAFSAAFLYAAAVEQESWVWDLYVAIAIVLFVLHMIALAQRLRDVGMAGAFALLTVTPFIGMFVILLFAFRPGHRGPNKYGRDPLHDPLLGQDFR